MKLKGVLHMHSTHSYDGKVTLSELKTFLKERGVKFACMTEHTDELTAETAAAFVEECKELSDDTFVFVPGFEVPYKNAHVLMIGCEKFICDFASDASKLKEWARCALLVVLAHPVRNKFEVDKDLLEVINGIEIWNQQYEGKHAPRTRSVKLYNELVLKKLGLLRTGGLDLHRREHFGSPQTEVDAAALSGLAIVAALKHGSFTFGPQNIPAQGDWEMSELDKRNSFLSVLVVNLGKKVNAALAVCGLKLPHSVAKAVRSKI